jgi:hypothetical protein
VAEHTGSGGGGGEDGLKRLGFRKGNGRDGSFRTRAHAMLAAKTLSKPPHVSAKPAKTILGVSPTKIIEFSQNSSWEQIWTNSKVEGLTIDLLKKPAQRHHVSQC